MIEKRNELKESCGKGWKLKQKYQLRLGYHIQS